VTCTGDATAVTVTVTNPVDARYRPGPAGRGLIGMRERVAVLGGSVQTGLTGREFVVSATLPRTLTEQPA
jgi:glucose-6-phosphate-specific signal transduction histidine kinase